jgi:hypothetical protein
MHKISNKPFIHQTGFKLGDVARIVIVTPSGSDYYEKLFFKETTPTQFQIVKRPAVAHLKMAA